MTRTLIGPDAVPFMFLFFSATAIAADAESGPETSITVTGYYYAMRDQSRSSPDGISPAGKA